VTQRISGVDEPNWPDERPPDRPVRWKPWVAGALAVVLIAGLGFAIWAGQASRHKSCSHTVVDLVDGAHGGAASPAAAAAEFSRTMTARGMPRDGWRSAGLNQVRNGKWTVTVSRLGDGTYAVIEADSC
jgi:hypothetical protein